MFGLFKKNSKSKNSDRLETDAIGCPPRSDELITGSNTNDSSNEIQVYQTPNQQVAIPEQQTIAQPSVCTPMSQIQIIGSSGFQLGNTYNIQSSRSHELHREVRKEPKIGKSRSIIEMMNSTSPIPDKLLDVISGNLGMRWKELMLLLGIDDLVRERAMIDYKDEGIKEVIYYLMENYFQSYPDKKTVGFLTTTLWQNDFRETVLKAKNKYKAMKRNNEL